MESIHKAMDESSDSYSDRVQEQYSVKRSKHNKIVRKFIHVNALFWSIVYAHYLNHNNQSDGAVFLDVFNEAGLGDYQPLQQILVFVIKLPKFSCFSFRISETLVFPQLKQIQKDLIKPKQVNISQDPLKPQESLRRNTYNYLKVQPFYFHPKFEMLFFFSVSREQKSGKTTRLSTAFNKMIEDTSNIESPERLHHAN